MEEKEELSEDDKMVLTKFFYYNLDRGLGEFTNLNVMLMRTKVAMDVDELLRSYNA